MGLPTITSTIGKIKMHSMAPPESKIQQYGEEERKEKTQERDLKEITGLHFQLVLSSEHQGGLYAFLLPS